MTKQISGLTEETVSASGDFAVIRDVSAGADRKIQLNNFVPDGSVTTAKFADNAVTLAKLEDSGWQTPTYAASYNASSNWEYRKVGGTVFFRGFAFKNSGNIAVSEVFGTIDAAYRPAQAMILQALGGGNTICKIRVNTDGTVESIASPSASSTNLVLDQVSYLVD